MVFDRLSVLHVALGRRLRTLSLVDGNVSWLESGVYSVEMVQVQGLTKVRVHEKWSCRSTIIDEELIPEDAKAVQLTNADLVHNFSKAGACLKFPKGQYLSLVTLFPTLQSRPLTRRFSDDCGATEALVPAQVSSKSSSAAVGGTSGRGKSSGKGKTKNKAGRGSSSGGDAVAAPESLQVGVSADVSGDVPSPVDMEEGVAAAALETGSAAQPDKDVVDGKRADPECVEDLPDGGGDSDLEES
eukprot:2906559-Amphidinium_carterae.2